MMAMLSMMLLVMNLMALLCVVPSFVICTIVLNTCILYSSVEQISNTKTNYHSYHI